MAAPSISNIMELNKVVIEGIKKLLLDDCHRPQLFCMLTEDLESRDKPLGVVSRPDPAPHLSCHFASESNRAEQYVKSGCAHHALGLDILSLMAALCSYVGVFELQYGVSFVNERPEDIIQEFMSAAFLVTTGNAIYAR